MIIDPPVSAKTVNAKTTTLSDARSWEEEMEDIQLAQCFLRSGYCTSSECAGQYWPFPWDYHQASRGESTSDAAYCLEELHEPTSSRSAFAPAEVCLQ